MQCFLGNRAGEYGKISSIATGKCITESRERTAGTVRRSGNADCRAEIHASLVMIPGSVFRYCGSRGFFKFSADFRKGDVFPDAEETGKNPKNVAVDGRDRYVISNGGDGSGCIGADAADLP